MLKGKVLQKPKDEDEAFSMLGSLSGEAHTVYTGFCVMTKDSFSVECIGTKVVFSVLSEETIKNYIQTKEPLDKAGGYGIQGIGSLLIERIEGDYFNVMGLPVKAVMEALYRQTGIRIL